MMNILLIYFVEYSSSDFNIRPYTAFAKTMIPLKKNFICQPVLQNVALDNLQKIFIAPGKTRASKTNYYFAAMVHHTYEYSVKIRKLQQHGPLI